MLFNKHAVQLFRNIFCVIVFVFLILPASAQSTKKRGRVTTYYANGKKESSGKVKKHEKQGVWKYWTENGDLVKTITYKDDSKEGLYTEYYKSGLKFIQGNYTHDVFKSGSWTSWYIDGKTYSVQNYDPRCDDVNPCYEGLQQWWYENGQLREEFLYTNRKIIYRVTYFMNGDKRAVENYKAGVKEGEWRTYPDPSEKKDTLPSTIDTYVNGKLDGVHLAYYHGRLSEEIFYKDGKLDGTFKKWDSNSQLGISEVYTNGNLNGQCKYFNYGKCIREAVYVNGKIDGTEKEFGNNGKMYRISWYKMGIVDSSNNFHSNGKISISRIYRYYPGFVRTEEFSDYREWDSTGVLLLHGTYHFEMKDKEWTTYYADGKTKSITPWTAGKIKGVYKKWYSNGKEMIEFECDGQNIITQPKVWDEKGKVIKSTTKYYEEIVDSSKPGEIYNDPKKYKENRTEKTTERSN